MMKTFSFLCLITVIMLSGCDYSYDYTYTVTNKSKTQIKVYVKNFRVDSTFLISKGSTKTLFTTSHGIEGRDGPYFGDVILDLEKFVVSEYDTLISKKDYLKNESWTFNKGEYSAIVTDAEFENKVVSH